MSAWTKDKTGEYVNWLAPPYFKPSTGVLVLALEGEDYHALNYEERIKRLLEYRALRERAFPHEKRFTQCQE